MSDSASSDRRGADPPHARTFSDVAKAHRWDDFTNVLHSEPCAREGLLYGIGVGFCVGVVRFTQRGRPLSAGNWAVGAFALTAIVAKRLCHYEHSHQRAKNQTLLEAQTRIAESRIKGFDPQTPSPSSSHAPSQTPPQTPSTPPPQDKSD
ncbi:hypothetical protein GGI07_003870 [Coemansia sp. Benny D115]|nr:hypothetical protein GGI07_003870 [Coemansia sp. Benny D115]